MEELKVAPEVLKQRVDTDAKLMGGINSAITSSVRNEKNLQKLRGKMSTEFRNLSNLENNVSMVSVYSEVAVGYDNISKSHLTYIDQVEKKVLPVLSDYQKKIKEVKNSVAAYQNKRTNVEKKRNAFRIDPSKKADVDKAEGEFAQEAMNFNKRIKAYQADRLTDTKQVLLHTINAEMHYHAKALERLSELAFKVYSIDDKKEAEEMLKTIFHPLPGQGQGQNVGQSQNYSQNIGQSQNYNPNQQNYNPNQQVSQSLVRPP